MRQEEEPHVARTSVPFSFLGRSERRALLRDLALVVVGQIALSAFVRSTGFVAISDDDYARVVIAQNWVDAPRLDPSGTSWLPFPLLLQGGFLGIFGATWEAARALAFGLGVVAALVLYMAARLARVPAGAALLVPFAFACLPTAAPFSIAVVPEYLTASLVVLGASTLLHAGRWRYLGATAFFLATASRYETWAAAAAFALLSTVDALKNKDVKLAGAATLGLAFPALWTLYGQLHHGSAFFFVERVTAYKRALGGDARGPMELASSYVIAWVTREPEVALLTLGLFLLGLSKRSVKPHSASFSRFAVVGGLVVLVLSLGDLRGGAPTHHPERTLLSVWALALVFCAQRISALSGRIWFVVPAALVLALPLRLRLEPNHYAERGEEEALGRALRERYGADERVAISTTDYGYFAIEAAAGHPSRFAVARTHDPRDRSRPLPVGLALRRAAESNGACVVALPLCVELDDVKTAAEIGAFQLGTITRDGCARDGAPPHSDR